jgi:ABC-2 type transport system ATP-binding protein
MITVRDLKKSYGEIHALKGISFHVPKGQIVGFLGPNGAGKTTTMKIVTGFMAPTSGAVEIDGLDAYAKPVEVKQRIGYLPESTPLYPDMVVWDYLRYVTELRGIPGSQRDEKIRAAARMCSIEAFVGREIGTLSKGQRQRVGLAQALVHDPAILILDEPTSGLDPNQIVEIRSLIRSLGQKRTIILSTHNLPEVMQTCDRLLIIHQGEIVADGTAAELEARETQNPRLVVQLAGNVDAATARQAVLSVPRVRQARDRTATAGTVSLEVETEPGADVRAELYRMAVDRQWTLLELRREALDLEGIFRRLTQSR